MDVDWGCGGIFSVSEINSALAAAQRRRVGWLSSLIPLPALLPSAASWYIPPALSLFIQLLWSTVCFISPSRRPFGEPVLSLLFVPVFLALAALFLRGFSGHLVNRACHFPGPAPFLCSLRLRRSRAHVGTSWTNRYSSRELIPEEYPALKGNDVSELLEFLEYILQHTRRLNGQESLE